MLLRRPSRILLAFALAARATLGQTAEDETEARQLLASPLWVDRAWGIFRAHRLALPGLDRLLLDQLASLQPYSDSPITSPEGACIQAIFDGLISARISVPASDLEPFAKKWRDDVLILLSRQQGNEDLLLSMRGEDLMQPQWTVVNNLLLAQRSVEFFSRTLAELSIRHRFVVVDPGTGGFGGGSGGGFAACGAIGFPRGFPPIGLYQLTDSPSEGDTLISPGPRAVYYRRTVVPTDKQAGTGIGGGTFDRQHDLLMYLAAWNQAKLEDAEKVFTPSTWVTWKDAPDFESRANAALSLQASAIGSFLSRAKQQGGPDPAGMSLRIVVDIEDHRQSGVPELPDISDLSFTVP